MSAGHRWGVPVPARNARGVRHRQARLLRVQAMEPGLQSGPQAGQDRSVLTRMVTRASQRPDRVPGLRCLAAHLEQGRRRRRAAVRLHALSGAPHPRLLAHRPGCGPRPRAVPSATETSRQRPAREDPRRPGHQGRGRDGDDPRRRCLTLGVCTPRWPVWVPRTARLLPARAVAQFG